jgi:hypothetical protein
MIALSGPVDTVAIGNKKFATFRRIKSSLSCEKEYNKSINTPLTPVNPFPTGYPTYTDPNQTTVGPSYFIGHVGKARTDGLLN